MERFRLWKNRKREVSSANDHFFIFSILGNLLLPLKGISEYIRHLKKLYVLFDFERS